MVLIYPLVFVTLAVRALAHLTTQRGWRSMRAWNSWPAAVAAGMGVALGFGSVTHFVEPQRSGLVAIVPSWFPHPELAVTGTGVLEIVLAAGMITPKSRRLAAVSTIVLLIAIFPANVVAAGGVDHPNAPDTPLLQRTILQIVFVGACVVASLPRKNRQRQSS